jgi:hypothetical protein
MRSRLVVAAEATAAEACVVVRKLPHLQRQSQLRVVPRSRLVAAAAATTAEACVVARKLTHLQRPLQLRVVLSMVDFSSIT